MNKKDTITRYGEAAYAKKLVQTRKWNADHPIEKAASSAEECKKGGKNYEYRLAYKQTGIPGDKNIVRTKHAKKWQKYKRIVAPESQLHHQWRNDGTAEYTGVALVEADRHMHGFVDVIEIMEGAITLFTEKEIRLQFG